jgi:hypothetical protein
MEAPVKVDAHIWLLEALVMVLMYFTVLHMSLCMSFC